jgi:hypothetical protein
MAAALPYIALGLMGAGTAASVYSSMNQPKAPQVPSTQSSDTTEAAAYAQAEAMRKRRGAASTILTGPQGDMGTPQTMKTQLGG